MRPLAVALSLPAVCALAAAGCGDGSTGPAGGGGGGGGEVQLELRQVATGLASPTYLTSPPGDDRLFVLEQPGRIRIVRDGSVESEPYLDVSSTVASGGEQGLLGLAFHPGFAQNGRFYLDFTVADGSDGATRVVEYTVPDPGADRARPTSADTLVEVDQFATNHNGGMLAFGPDGMLYVALGDGGGAGDPRENGQDSTTVLGSLLRLDVDRPDLIPPDNPFVGRAGNDSIWAYGLRNPWRFAFDPPDGTLYVADVGQSDFEEVNAVPDDRGGVNYGWDVMEGASCFDDPHEPGQACEPDDFTAPVLDYSHDEGCSVTGGFVYRGSSVPGIRGRYFFADLCSGFLRSFRLEGGEAADVVEHDVRDPGTVTSFGTGGDGELYLLVQEGTVFRISAP